MEVDENKNVENVENVVNESYEERRFQDTKKKSPRYYKFHDKGGNIILDDKNSGMSKPSSKFQSNEKYNPIKLLSNIPFSLVFDTGNNIFYTLNQGHINVDVVEQFYEMLKTEVEDINFYLNDPGINANLNPSEVDQLKEKINARIDYIMELQTNISEARARTRAEAGARGLNYKFFNVRKSILNELKFVIEDKKDGIYRIYYDKNRALYYASIALFVTSIPDRLTAELTNKQVEQIRDLMRQKTINTDSNLLLNMFIQKVAEEKAEAAPFLFAAADYDADAV